MTDDSPSLDPVDAILDGLMESAAPVGNTSGGHLDDRESKIIVGTTEAGLTTRTEAPTNTGTYEALDAIINDARLTEKEHDFVSLVDMHWGMYGELLTAAKAKEDYGIPQSRFVKLMGSGAVRSAIEERGVSFKGVDHGNKWRSNALTPLQLLAAKSLLDITDTRSDKKKLQDLGIDTKTYNAWKRDPVFTQYLEKTATGLLEGSHHEAMLSLIDGMRSGNIKATQLYLEFTGKYVPKHQQVGPDVDMKGLLTRILEIILDVVKDPIERATIADRLLGLGQANTIAGQVVDNEPLPVPEVMPARELTGELKEMLDNGLGINI